MLIKSLLPVLFFFAGTSYGQVSAFGGNFQAPTIEDKEDVKDPQLGEIIFDYTNATSGSFYGYDGDSWVDLSATAASATSTTEGLVKATKTYTESDVTFSSTPSGWSNPIFYGVPYQTVDGQWWLRFTLKATITAASNVNVTLDGVSWAETTALSSIPPSSGATANAFASGTGTITRYTSSTYASFYAAGDVPLSGKPTWAD